ncbi:hypothetical protein NC653_041938 [Populus alba x Populus x berolinensis]|uniref:Uncharacterized protein n=1 Tax=Populus alba x Populus x berolinensis TaxID=444605 RepID=A0AAD6L9Z8_9ROSI|nr:hypothetical protein NC653_041938 [Populus alba x Populus x berolinensis]
MEASSEGESSGISKSHSLRTSKSGESIPFN